ncbi:MAG: hypothetical protein WBH85_04400 [Thermoanaerobaculia bacterium]
MSCSLKVERSALVDLLKTAARVGKASDKAEAVLSFDGQALGIEMTGMSLGIPATGEWDGEVLVPASLILRLRRHLPSGDQLEVSVRKERLWIEDFSVSCKRQPAMGNRIELPLDPTLQEILSLPHRYSRVTIERSGQSKMVEEAEEKMERCISRAAVNLKPLGVEPSDVRWIVVKTLDRYSRR